MPHIWMSHVTRVNATLGHCECIRESWHTFECHTHTYKWVMAHVWSNHVTNTNVMLWPLQLYARVLARVWMSNCKCMNELCHTYEWVMSHIILGLAPAWMSHYGQCECLRFQAVMLRTWAHLNHVGHTCEWVTSQISMRHDAHMMNAS